jgi:hypothetical protein
LTKASALHLPLLLHRRRRKRLLQNLRWKKHPLPLPLLPLLQNLKCPKKKSLPLLNPLLSLKLLKKLPCPKQLKKRPKKPPKKVLRTKSKLREAKNVGADAAVANPHLNVLFETRAHP